MRRAILVFVCAIGLFGLGATASAVPLQSEGNTLTVKIDGKGNVKSNPPGIDCPGDCQSDFDSEETVVLTAKPAQGWVFDHWENCGTFDRAIGAAAAADDPTCTVFMDGPITVTAVFKEKSNEPPLKKLFPLTVTVNGVGSAASEPAGIDCGTDCIESYPEGTVVTLGPFQNATNFTSWGGDCSGSGLCTVAMTGPKAVTANFVNRNAPGPETKPTGDEPGTGTTGPFHLQLDFDCFSENEAFLAALYEDVLGRPADQVAFSRYLPLLTGGTSPTAVALLVLQSLEHREMLVRNFYRSFLHRVPSPEELVAGLEALVEGTTDGYMAALLGSEEYFQTRGGGTEAGFLDALFHDLLGRAPTPGERTLFAGASRAEVAAQVLASTEYRTKLIQNDFELYLGRPPTAAELSSFLAMFTAGATQESVAAAILGSAEYIGMAAEYHATVDWGDGTTSPGMVKHTGDHCTIDATHTYTGPGTFPLDVDVTAPDGSLTNFTHKLVIGGDKLPPPGKENVRVIGVVLIKLKGKFVPLKGFKQIPLGSELDTTRGRATLTNPDGSTSTFYEGRFLVLGSTDTPTPGTTKKVVVIVLTGGNLAGCTARTTAGVSKPKPTGKPIRHVWGNAKGSFRTKGKYASATVRGTLWKTTDYCNGTLITVLRGTVDVFDLVLKKHFLIQAGHSYFAPRS